VLLANCRQCHGPSASVADSGGFRFIDDLDRLIATGLLVPLSSATSPIIITMVDGSMPPPESGLPSVTQADIDTVAQYLDNPRFWPGVAPPSSDAGSPSVSDAGTDLPDSDAGSSPVP
jgi:mono/diheme cytochrome c family protein